MYLNGHTSPFIGSKELDAIIPYTQVHIRRLEEKGLFPKRIRFGANRIAWYRIEIEEWLSARMADRSGRQLHKINCRPEAFFKEQACPALDRLVDLSTKKVGVNKNV